MKLKSQHVLGMEIPIELNESSGYFSAVVDEADYSAKSLEELVKQLTPAVRALKDQHAVSISIVGLVPQTESKSKWGRTDPYVEGIGVVHGKLRGKHGRNSSYLIEAVEAGKTIRFNLSTYSGHSHICLPLSLQDVLAYTDLAMAAQTADNNLKAWIREHEVDAKEILRMMGADTSESV